MKRTPPLLFLLTALGACSSAGGGPERRNRPRRGWVECLGHSAGN